MSEPVNLQFRYTEGEYVSAIRAYILAKRRILAYVGIASGITLLGTYYLLTESDPVFSLFLLATGLLMFGLLATSFVIIPHRRFHGNPQFQSEYYLQFSEDGILFQTDHIDSTLKWGIYTEALETEKFYLLAYGEGAVTVIPKRVFKSDEQQILFKDMLRRKVTG